MNSSYFGAERLRHIVIEELTAVGGRIKNDEMVVLCPFHNDTHPSLQVHIGHKISPGGFHCFSCGAHGNWNKLAQALNLRQIDVAQNNKITDADDPFNILSNSLKRDPQLNQRDERILKGLEDIPDGFQYRGYGKSFYETLNAKFFWNRKQDQDYLYFPLTINGQYKGYTICAINPVDPKIEKYMTFADTEKVFLLYDQIKSNESVVITEGHFDAIRLHAEGINALCMFGTSAWSGIKKNLVIAKNPKKVIIAMDNDESGRKAAEQIFYDLRSGVTVEVFSILPTLEQSGNKIDPGNMSEEYVENLRGLL